MDKSGNPALKPSALDRLRLLESSDTATVGGTIFKTLILFAFVIIGAFLGWRMAANNAESLGLVLISSSIGGMILGFTTIFVPKISPFTSPVYSLVQGILLGAISQILNTEYDGIAIQALLLTGGVFVSVLFLYSSRIVKVTAKLRAVVLIATLAIALYYVTAFIASLFGSSLPLIYDGGTFGIIFSLIVVFVAALNLLLDFDFIERTAASGMPKLFEWYGAFSLMVTLIWLYIEILRLLAKIRR